MNILINCSNLKIGGGLQVAHSFLHQIRNNRGHQFTIILSSILAEQINQQDYSSNFQFLVYDISPNIFKIFTGKDDFLNGQVRENSIQVVFSIFGPTYWRPEVRHIAGYAKAQYIYKESPLFRILTLKEKLKLNIKRYFHLQDFSRNNDMLITENKDVTLRLGSILKEKSIKTVTNYYNQIFDKKENWKNDISLERLDGFKLLTISANYRHKNLPIILEVVKVLNNKYPDFNYYFVITVDESFLYEIKDQNILDRIKVIGRVDINQTPHLYSQTSACFLPTLVESSTANYPEAMRMDKPILTSDLDFARGLCGKAAVYFDPLDPEDIADKIFELANDNSRQNQLAQRGKEQLKKFDNYSERAIKYLDIIEK